MIPRYTRPELAALWSDAHRLALFLQIELGACAALEAAPDSPIPPGTTARLREAAQRSGPLSSERIAELEQRTQHDVLAFLAHVEERLGPEARFLHFGLTSSDILDTALALQLRDATDLILGGLSCIIWTLTLVTTVKYVLVTLRADNHGWGFGGGWLPRLTNSRCFIAAPHRFKAIC